MNSNRTKSEELLTVFVEVAAINRRTLMPPLRGIGSRRIRFSVMCLRTAKIMRRMTGAGAHLVISEGHVHAPVQAILH